MKKHTWAYGAAKSHPVRQQPNPASTLASTHAGRNNRDSAGESDGKGGTCTTGIPWSNPGFNVLALAVTAVLFTGVIEDAAARDGHRQRRARPTATPTPTSRTVQPTRAPTPIPTTVAPTRLPTPVATTTPTPATTAVPTNAPPDTPTRVPTGIPTTTPESGAGNEWKTPAGTVQGTRFSQLSQINDSNVSSLQREFFFSTGIKASHEGGALMVGDTMYIVGPYPNKLYAFNLNTPGQTRWIFAPKVSKYAQGVACCDVVNRGAAYANGKIIYNLLDNSTVAVDAATGKQVWRTSNGDPHTGQTITMMPLIVGNKVLIGNSGAELGVRGWVAALDVDSGRQVWKAYNTGPDADVKIGAGFHAHYAKDQGKDLGKTTWPAELWKQGGSTAWNQFTYDPDLHLFYYGTANPGVWNPEMRLGDNKWGSSIIARDPDTGAAKWAYQVTPHDQWDYDSVSESIVTTLPINGIPRKVLVHFDKNGFGYTLDAKTGEVLVANPFVNHVTWASHIDLVSGAPVINPATELHEGEKISGICPAALGAKGWEPAAYSPKTSLFYIPAINFCQTMQALKAEYIAGTPFMGMDIGLTPDGGGELVAWDAVKGERKWANHDDHPLYGGVLATAGNLVFYGTLDKKFKALNATTGGELWTKDLPCGTVSNPTTFMGPDGKQRVALMTGVGYLNGGVGTGACPEGSRWQDEGGSRGNTSGAGVVVYKLP